MAKNCRCLRCGEKTKFKKMYNCEKCNQYFCYVCYTEEFNKHTCFDCNTLMRTREIQQAVRTLIKSIKELKAEITTIDCS